MQKSRRPIVVPDMYAAKAKIEGIFRELKPKRLTKENTYLPLDFHEFLIDHFSEDLALLVFPDPVQPSLRDTRRQLQKLETDSRAFWISLASLQGPAVDALKFTDPTLGGLQRTVERLLAAASLAKARTLQKGRKGAKPNVRAQEIAVKAASYYARITGNRPVRVTYPGNAKARAPKDKKALVTSEFFEFLAAIFKALSVSASADRYGKIAIRVWTDNHPHWPK